MFAAAQQAVVRWLISSQACLQKQENLNSPSLNTFKCACKKAINSFRIKANATEMLEVPLRRLSRSVANFVTELWQLFCMQLETTLRALYRFKELRKGKINLMRP